MFLSPRKLCAQGCLPRVSPGLWGRPLLSRGDQPASWQFHSVSKGAIRGHGSGFHGLWVFGGYSAPLQVGNRLGGRAVCPEPDGLEAP